MSTWGLSKLISRKIYLCKKRLLGLLFVVHWRKNFKVKFCGRSSSAGLLPAGRKKVRTLSYTAMAGFTKQLPKFEPTNPWTPVISIFIICYRLLSYNLPFTTGRPLPANSFISQLFNGRSHLTLAYIQQLRQSSPRY